MKVFSVVGYTKSGKTSAVIELVKELKLRGYKIGTIKDIHYEKFTMETENSDSWLHWKTSNGVVFARGLNETYQIWHRQLALEEMLKHLNADYVIVEGMKTFPLPKIVCAKSKEELDELVDGTVIAISGIYANDNKSYKKFKVFHSKKQAKDLTDIVEEKVFDVLPYPEEKCCKACGFTCKEMVEKILSGEKTRADCVLDRSKQLTLKIGGKEIKIVPFVQNTFKDVILGFVKNLRGYKKGKIEIEIDE